MWGLSLLIFMSTAPKYKVTKDYVLIIHNVTQMDARKNYMCRAMDMDSPIPDSKVMNITLKVKSMCHTIWEI